MLDPIRLTSSVASSLTQFDPMSDLTAAPAALLDPVLGLGGGTSVFDAGDSSTAEDTAAAKTPPSIIQQLTPFIEGILKVFLDQILKTIDQIVQSSATLDDAGETAIDDGSGAGDDASASAIDDPSGAPDLPGGASAAADPAAADSASAAAPAASDTVSPCIASNLAGAHANAPSLVQASADAAPAAQPDSLKRRILEALNIASAVMTIAAIYRRSTDILRGIGAGVSVAGRAALGAASKVAVPVINAGKKIGQLSGLARFLAAL
jgi:hypothetical protein